MNLPRPRHFLPALPPNPPVPQGFLEDQDELPPAQGSPSVQRVGSLLKPGCTAADNVIVARGHLEGLARGLGGFGVLRESKRHLEEASRAAGVLGQTALVSRIDRVANQMPEVRDPETARALADQLAPLVDDAWELGRRCKGVST